MNSSARPDLADPSLEEILGRTEAKLKRVLSRYRIPAQGRRRHPPGHFSHPGLQARDHSQSRGLAGRDSGQPLHRLLAAAPQPALRARRLHHSRVAGRRRGAGAGADGPAGRPRGHAVLSAQSLPFRPQVALWLWLYHGRGCASDRLLQIQYPQGYAPLPVGPHRATRELRLSPRGVKNRAASLSGHRGAKVLR